jgi:outer membrane lipoprotein-sorting protein
MKKTIFTLIFIGVFLSGYAQNEVKSDELTSPIMLDFLKNYQEKNSIQKIEKGIPFTSELSKRGIQGDRYIKPELENIDNMVIVKPNLVEIMRMPVVYPEASMHHTMRIVNSDTNKLQPIK